MEDKTLTFRIIKYFGRYRAFVKVIQSELMPFCNSNFTDEDYFQLSRLKEIPCILVGDFTNFINSMPDDEEYYSIDFNNSKIFVDKPNKNKSEDPIKNQFRVKIIKE